MKVRKEKPDPTRPPRRGGVEKMWGNFVPLRQKGDSGGFGGFCQAFNKLCDISHVLIRIKSNPPIPSGPPPLRKEDEIKILKRKVPLWGI